MKFTPNPGTFAAGQILSTGYCDLRLKRRFGSNQKPAATKGGKTMKYTFTHEIRVILLDKLRVYHRHYHKKTDPKITLKEYVRRLPLTSSRYYKIPNDSIYKTVTVKIGRAYFRFRGDAKTLAIIYRNANRRDCRC
jgi:hypothetical protein